MRRFTIAVLTLGVFLTMGILRVLDLRSTRDEILRTAESQGANFAHILAEYFTGTFAAGDASLRQLVVHSRRIGGPSAPAAEWMPSLTSARAGLTAFGAISVADRDGVIRHTTQPRILGQRRGHEPVVRDALAAAEDTLVIGTPVQSPFPGRPPLIPLGRPLMKADGTPEGVVVASFIPDAAGPFFRTLNVGSRGVIWVFHPSGVLLFREAGGKRAIGGDARANIIFSAAQSAKTGSVRAPLEPGGEEFLSSFHVADTPPLIVGISLERGEVLQAWRREVFGSIVLFGGGTFILGTTLLVLFRQMDAKARAEDALARAREEESVRLREANGRLADALQRESLARQEVEAASALKDQFLMTVSHELRTPLTAIYGWSRMLNDGVVDTARREGALRIIERNANVQMRLIDDLLDMARAMSGKLRLDMRETAVNDVIDSAVETVAPAAQARNIRIKTSIQPTARIVMADPERLQQIVWNLLSNAVKFTPPGGRVEVDVAREGDNVRIAVIDSGVGVSAEFLPHVFERFRQQDSSTTRRFGGLGLGLAIVRNLTELHGGSVAAHSDGVDKGATFIVRLPAPAGAIAGSAPDAARPPIVSAPLRNRLGGVRVLVVDDDAETRELFSMILHAAGATVTLADSAQPALDVLQVEPQDVLLSDIEMPDVDGYSLARQAIAMAKRHGRCLHAIAITAYSRPEDEARSLAAGFERHVRKPVDPITLVATIAAAMPDRDADVEHQPS